MIQAAVCATASVSTSPTIVSDPSGVFASLAKGFQKDAERIVAAYEALYARAARTKGKDPA